MNSGSTVLMTADYEKHPGDQNGLQFSLMQPGALCPPHRVDEFKESNHEEPCF